LAERRQRQQLRQITPRLSDPAWLDLTHNDYLGLRDEPSFQAAVRQTCAHLPVGSGASRLLGGEHTVYGEVETAFSQWKRAASSLYFSSGYLANETLGALLGRLPDVRVFSDQLNHASIIDGLRLSGLPKERRRIFRHNDLNDLTDQLRHCRAKLRFIWTESVFSMDGDYAPLNELGQLAEHYGAILIVDEAHALGCFGETGQGLLAHHQLDPNRVISINPCGKAVAAAGAFVTGPTWWRDFMINFGRGFIYSTGTSPWVAAAVGEAINYLQPMHAPRRHLQALAASFRERLHHLGFDTGQSASHICPVIVGSESAAMSLARHLAKFKILARPIRPPTVPADSCRLRISLHSRLTYKDLAHIEEAFQSWQANPT
jgi:8-amino-7-oxononanoate synthase